jgi:hypothetical protein
MYPHPASISRLVWRAKSETAAQPDAAEQPAQKPNFYRGVFFGVLFSLPLWAGIGWGIYELVKR